MSEPANKCRVCDHYNPTSLFELCSHAASTYRFDDRSHQHTVGHMRTRGSCGENAVLFKVKEQAA